MTLPRYAAPEDWRGDADMPQPDPDDPGTHPPRLPDLTQEQFQQACLDEGFRYLLYGWFNLGLPQGCCACVIDPAAGYTRRDKLSYLRLRREHWQRFFAEVHAEERCYGEHSREACRDRDEEPCDE